YHHREHGEEKEKIFLSAARSASVLSVVKLFWVKPIQEIKKLLSPQRIRRREGEDLSQCSAQRLCALGGQIVLG
ncbi:hypothetical protein, partial [Pseudoalteromonas atlantica]|uniref:hypothetical protein n=1 Tax=Pseudoalteromonas atlantica TaxID=288 RepID=UPI003B42FEAF